jgi:primosomal protein N' (replication factor Y)
MSPQHPAIRLAAAHDYEGFAQHESELRAELAYPPHGRLVRLLWEDASEKLVVDSSTAAGDALRDKLLDSSAVVLGPAPAPIAIARDRHRRHLLVKVSGDEAQMQLVLDAVRSSADAAPKLRAVIDVDPVSLF